MNDSFWDMDPEKPIWTKEWVGMPEFNQNDLTPVKQLIINFSKKEDYEQFQQLLGQKLTLKTKSVWYPAKQAAKLKDFVYKSFIDEE